MLNLWGNLILTVTNLSQNFNGSGFLYNSKILYHTLRLMSTVFYEFKKGCIILKFFKKVLGKNGNINYDIW